MMQGEQPGEQDLVRLLLKVALRIGHFLWKSYYIADSVLRRDL